MNEKEIYERLNIIFKDVFMDESIVVGSETTSSDIEDWDSLMHITLISEIESVFSIKFDSKTTSDMKNVGEMVAYIEQAINKI